MVLRGNNYYLVHSWQIKLIFGSQVLDYENQRSYNVSKTFLNCANSEINTRLNIRLIVDREPCCFAYTLF